jgi:class II poly(R)-hydroxyalkanoic acid synthase
MLTDAAAGGRPGLLSAGVTGRMAGSLLRRPARVARRTGGLVGDLAQVTAGRSEIAPSKGDKRFLDPAWSGNPAFKRVMQTYLAYGAALQGLVDDAELDWQDDRRARFTLANIVDAMAPTNVPWGNPAVIKETLDRGGANLVRGGRRALRDVTSRPPRLPATVDTSRFAVGENLAVSPGSVVLRTDVFELIHYAPSTPEVYEVPTLVIPPTINKYYVLDLAPGRSLVEYAVSQGQQVFLISWRNPTVEHGAFDLETYVSAVLEARDAASEISGSPTVGIQAACSGGMITATALAHLAAKGTLQDKIAHLTLLVCLLDSARAGTSSAMVTREAAAAAIAESARKGYVDGKALASVFAWLRPNDLVWGYVVNNYLMGKDPPAFDVLYWNQDTVRMSAGLHRDFMKIALDNLLTRAGEMHVLGTPIDMSKIDVPSYVVAGTTDHIVPWETAWRSARLLGGHVRFVLSSSGHIQALVNPAGPKSKSSYRTTEELPVDNEAWAREAPMHAGSWWGDHAPWVAENSGALRAAPAELGSKLHPPMGKAPGSYVHAT